MKAVHTGAATSLLSEVATPLYGFILAAATLNAAWRGGRQNIQIHIFYLFRLVKWIWQCYLIIYIRCKATI